MSLPSRFGLPWVVVLLAQLATIWAFPHVPTQDGPVHVASAIAFRDLGEPGTSYATLFERRIEPFPNWTAHLLLAALTSILEPSVAEKIVMSLWFVLWPLGAWRLAGVVGADRSVAVGVALLLAFGRVFWLGFYNFLLGTASALLLLAWSENPRRQRSIGETVWLSVLLLVLFLTHLGPWVLVVTVLTAFGLVSTDRKRRMAGLLVATAPSFVLALLFVYQTATETSGGASRALRGLARSAGTPRGLLASLRLEWFEAHAGVTATALTVATLALLSALVIGGVQTWRRAGARQPLGSIVLALGACGAFAFVVGPDDAGPDAGFFKARLALLAPVLLVLGLPRPRRALRPLLASLLLALNAWSLVGVLLFLSGVQETIREFTAARDVVGSGKTLVLLHDEDPAAPIDVVNPNLYCLGTGNASAANYQAGTRHFPLKYRPGIRRAAREMARQTRPVWTDVALLWDIDEPRPRGLTRDYVEVYRRGRLRVFAQRPAEPPSESGTGPPRATTPIGPSRVGPMNH